MPESGGAELADGAYRQAQRLGAEFLIGTPVHHARPQADGAFEIEFLSGSTIRAHSGLVATGVAYRRLDIPEIEELVGRGVRYGSPSGEAAGYAGRRVAIVGGANSAAQAALHLAEHAAQVTMLVRRDALHHGMSRYLIDRIQQHDRITVLTRSRVVGGYGRDCLESMAIEGPEGVQTLFITGDVRHGSIKRVASAVGEGAMAASLVQSYLAARDGDNGH